MQRRLVGVAAIAAGALLLTSCSTGGGGGGGGSNTDGLSGLKAAPACADATAPTELGALPDAPDPDVKGTVTLWGWYNVAPESTTALMAKYYPNVELKFVDYSLADTSTKVQTALNAGSGAPDLAMIEDKTLPSVWGNGLYDLTNCLKPYTDSFPKFKWNRITRPDGVQAAVPWEINPAFITYRRDVFEKYGINPDDIKTWDDYVAAGKKVVQESGGKVAWTESNLNETGNGTSALNGDITYLVNQNGGQFFSQDGKSTFNSPQTIEALDLVKSFRDKGIAAPDFSSKQAELNALQNGEVATFIGPASSRFFMSGSLADTAGKWGIFPLPAFKDGGTRGAVNGGTSIVMPSQSKNSEAAWAFLRIWLLSVDGRYDSFQAGQLVENVFLPAAADSRFQQPDEFYGGDPFLEVSIKAAQAAPVSPSSPKWPQVSDAIQANLPAFMDGSMSAEDFAQKAQDAGK
jgi:lactose/L-arabinose transport system substrate-binding protein